jgi:hypothetical protein
MVRRRHWRSLVFHGLLVALWGISASPFAAAQSDALRSTPAQIGRSASELTVPAPPDDGTKPTCKPAREYMNLRGSGRYEAIAALFAENAVHYGPDGITRHGRAEISRFYMGMKSGGTNIYAGSYLQDGNRCVVHLVGGGSGQDARPSLTAIDDMTINAQGKIERFIVFLSPAPRPSPR